MQPNEKKLPRVGGSAIADERHAALLRAMQDANWTFRAHELASWRATRRSTGYITGLESLGQLTLLATDSNRGLFLTASGAALLAHLYLAALDSDGKPIPVFTGIVETLIKKPKPAREPRVK